MKIHHYLASIALALVALVPHLAFANDSTASVGLGGLELTRNDDISMDSEELFLSADKVTVKYRFTNTSDKDVETLVSFPLPDMPIRADGDGDVAISDLAEIAFSTRVDGAEVQLQHVEKIEVRGHPEITDAAAVIARKGWPLRYWEDDRFLGGLLYLPESSQDKYVASGYFVRDEEGGIRPNWYIATHVTRTQNFPAGKTISVEHSYVPLLGGSVGGSMNKSLREESYGWKEYRDQYCIDNDFITAFDRKYKQMGEKADHYSDTWLSYVLSSGANWKGPIKDFRLVVDKGDSGNLVSFCMDGIKKISPTQFEIRKTNFEPVKDLDILIIAWHSDE